MKKIISIILVFAALLYVNASAQQDEILNAAELQIAIQKLNVLGSVLYLAAHPDDENTAVLAYFSKGRKYRTAYLSLTRGDGGQNLIGPEKGAEIGIIRTQELMAAREIDKAEQFFTRAIDFGYSKTAEETFEFWGKDETLADVVWVIRKFRPDVIITRFPPDRYGGHGHHTASAIIAEEAFQAAADPQKFPEQLKYVQPWQAKRICWNSWRPGPQERENLLKVNMGEYNPLLGKSYSEIAAESRSKHKSQGFGATGRRGIRYDYFEITGGESATTDIFEGIDTTWDRVRGGRNIGKAIGDIVQSFDPKKPSQSIPKLLVVNEMLNRLDKSYWVIHKQKDLLRVIQSCAGLWMEAIADDFSCAPGDRIRLRTTIVNRSDHPFKLEKLSVPAVSADTVLNIIIKNNEPVSVEKMLSIPKDYSISQPYWLETAPQKGRFSISDQNRIGLAENPPSIGVNITLSSNESSLEYTLPIFYRWTDRVAGELYRSFEIRPLVTVKLNNTINIFADGNSREIKIMIKSQTINVVGKIRLKGPKTWKVSPASIPFSLTDKYEERAVVFHVSPPKHPDQAEFVAEAEINDETFSKDLVEISYPHIKRQVFFPKSQVKMVKLDIKRLNGKLGYIMGAGDNVPDGLRNLGYDVILLTDEMLDNVDLSQFDAIITGIRAYNTRERLKNVQPKLLEYVNKGRTLIVQYNVSRGLQTDNIGPYPFTIGRDRVSVETAAVTFIDPNHPLLNFPNKITQKDFRGWVQERGLYFASHWDEKYQPVIASHDPNENNKNGGILFTRYGKGTFIYTGISFFRQLPAGVPGAYRLFVNLISAGKNHEK